MLSFKEIVALTEHIEHRGGEWVVLNKARTKILGKHALRKDALAQLAAIEINKHKAAA